MSQDTLTIWFPSLGNPPEKNNVVFYMAETPIRIKRSNGLTIILEDGKFYRIKGDKKKLIKANAPDLGVEDRVGAMIDGAEPSEAAGAALFDTILRDLRLGATKELPWLPNGHYYFDNKEMTVFKSEKRCRRYLQYQRHEFFPFVDIIVEDDKYWDPVKEEVKPPKDQGVGFSFPSVGSDYDGYDIKYVAMKAFGISQGNQVAFAKIWQLYTKLSKLVSGCGIKTSWRTMSANKEETETLAEKQWKEIAREGGRVQILDDYIVLSGGEIEFQIIVGSDAKITEAKKTCMALVDIINQVYVGVLFTEMAEIIKTAEVGGTLKFYNVVPRLREKEDKYFNVYYLDIHCSIDKCALSVPIAHDGVGSPLLTSARLSSPPFLNGGDQ